MRDAALFYVAAAVGRNHAGLAYDRESWSEQMRSERCATGLQPAGFRVSMKEAAETVTVTFMTS